MEELFLDYVLVPLGLLLMGVYHVWLFITILYNPRRTVIGFNAECRQAWIMNVSLLSCCLCVCVQFMVLAMKLKPRFTWKLICIFRLFVIFGSYLQDTRKFPRALNSNSFKCSILFCFVKKLIAFFPLSPLDISNDF